MTLLFLFGFKSTCVLYSLLWRIKIETFHLYSTLSSSKEKAYHKQNSKDIAMND